MESMLLRVPEVARILSLGRSKTYELVLSGEIGPVIRIGRSVRVPAEALRRWVEGKIAEASNDGSNPPYLSR